LVGHCVCWPWKVRLCIITAHPADCSGECAIGFAGRALLDAATGSFATERETETTMIKEFKDFIAGGNMLELAVAVILGAAIGAVIDAFTTNVMMQIIAAIVGEPSFDQLSFDLNDTPIGYGSVITAFIRLVMVGLVLFFMVKAYNKIKKPAEAGPAGPTEVELLTEIRDSLRTR
jgi:large conductance mechanosensitive channel